MLAINLDFSICEHVDYKVIICYTFNLISESSSSGSDSEDSDIDDTKIQSSIFMQVI